MAKKNCGQINIPEVDNSSNCDSFNYSECIIVTHRSKFVKNKPGGNLNEYLQLLDDKMNKMNNQIYHLTQIIKEYEPSEGIGIFPV